MGAQTEDIQHAIEMEDLPLWLRELISDAADEVNACHRLIRKLAENWELEPNGWLILRVLGHNEELFTVARVLLEPNDAETLRAVMA